MLNFAYDTPELFQFAEQLPIEPDAPVLMLMQGIINRCISIRTIPRSHAPAWERIG